MSRPLQTYRLAPDAPHGDTSPLAYDTGNQPHYAAQLAALTAPAALARVQAMGDPDSGYRQAGARGGFTGHRNQPAKYQRRTLPRAKAAK